MKAENDSISVRPACRQEEFLWEGLPLIRCEFRMPSLAGPGRGAHRIDRYYRRVEELILRRLRSLSPRFSLLAQRALSASLPIPHCRVWTDFETAFQDERFLSIRWSLMTEGSVTHHCDLWELPWGAPVSPKLLLPRSLHRKASSAPCLVRADGVYLLREEGEERIFARED